MNETYNDPVDVLVSFRGTTVRPETIHWGRNSFRVDKVNLIHSAREGDNKIYFFSVSDDTHSFKLRFDPGLMEWRLLELYTEG